MSPLNRRQLLSCGPLAALGALMAASSPPALAGVIDSVRPRAGSYAGGQRGTLVRAPKPIVPTAPLQLVSDVNMSQDYFLSSAVLIGEDTDSVIPVIVDSASGAVGAIVLENGVPYLLKPAAGNPTGWAYKSFLPAGSPTVQNLTAAATAGGPVYLKSAGEDGFIGSIDSAGAFTSQPVSEGPWTVEPQAAVDASGNAAFFGWGSADSIDVFYPSPIGTVGDWTSETVEINPDPINPKQNPKNLKWSGVTDSAMVTNKQSQAVYGMTIDPQGGCSFVSVAGWQPMTDSSEFAQVYSTGILAPAIADPSSGAAIAVMFNYSGVGGSVSAGDPFVATLNSNGDFIDQVPMMVVGADAAGAPTVIGPIAQSAWLCDGEGHLICYLLTAPGDPQSPDPSTTPSTVYLQSVDLTASPAVASTPIPIATDISAVYLPQSGATVNTDLFVVGLDQTLQVLSRNSATGAWTVTPINTGSATNQELNTFRTMLTVTDADGLPCPNIQLQITPSEDLAVWQPTGSTVLSAGTATTFTTDAWGVVTLATPAAAMYSPTLTITSTSTFAQPSYTVAPDAELHAFLGGTGTLLQLPNAAGTTGLTAAHLQAATNSANTPLFPSLAGNATAAGQVASVITQTMQAGVNPTTNPNSSPGYTLNGLSPSKPPSLAASSQQLDSSVGDWWNNVKSDIESVYQAIESGVVTVTAANLLFAAGAWTLKLAITIGKYVVDTVTLVISDLRTAAIAVGSFFQALGADIAEAINWLRMIVLDLFENVGHAADVINELLTITMPALVDSAVAQAQKYITGPNFFADTVSKDITPQVSNNLPAGSFTGAKPTPKPTNPNQQQGSTPTSNAKSGWLLDKVKTASVPSTAPDTTSSGTFASDFKTTAEDAGANIRKVFKGVIDGISEPKEFLNNGWPDLKTGITGLLGDALTTADLMIADLLGLIGTTLNDVTGKLVTPLDDIPVIGDLFTLLGVSAKLTPAYLASLLVAFPVVVVGELVTGSSDWVPTLADVPVVGQLSSSAGNDWGKFIDAALMISSALAGSVSAAVAIINSQTDGQAPHVLLLLNAVTGIIQETFEYPFSSTSPLSLAPRQVKWGTAFGDDAPLILWVLEFVPLLISLFPMTAAAGSIWQTVVTVVNTIFGIILTGMSIGVGSTAHLNGGSIAEDVVSQLPNVAAFCGMSEVAAATEDVSPVVLVLIIALEAGVYAVVSFIELVGA